MKHSKLLAVAALAALLLSYPFTALAFQMATGSYTGDGNDNRSITGVGFQPDLVIVKGDGGTGVQAVWRSSAMSGDVTARFYSGQPLLADRIQALEADGFEVGTDEDANQSGVAYYYMAFRDNGDGDFKVGTYTGDGNDDRSITGVGFQPDLVVLDCDASSATGYGVWRPSSLAGDAALYFKDVASVADTIQALEADGFQVGQHAAANTAATTYYYFAFKAVANEFAVGSYSGDGNDDRSITGVGFEPDYVWVKKETGGTARLARHCSDQHGADDSMHFDDLANAADGIQALETDGFQVGTDNTVNEDTYTYHYAAWKAPSGGGAAYPVGAATLILP